MPITRQARSYVAEGGLLRPATTSRGRPNNERRGPPPTGRRHERGRRRMSGSVIETLMGAVVLVAAALFLFFAYSTSQIRSVAGYPVTAQFQSVDGIRDGSDVRIGGVKVGSVVAERL